MVGVSNQKTPRAKDLKVCAQNDRCVQEGRKPKWLRLKCRSPVRGNYLVIIRKKKGTDPLAIAEIKVKEIKDFINMFPEGNNI